jgi:phospholipid/cholesterol/gamma-HCH transport system ATP-binding protein
LAEKRVIAIGTLDEVRRSDHPWINEYFSGPRGRAALSAKNGAGAGAEKV